MPNGDAAVGPLPKHVALDLKAQPHSRTHKLAELRIFGNDHEQIQIPVEVSTSVWEVKCMIAYRLGLDPCTLDFSTKQGCSWRTQLDYEEVARKVLVRGTRSFVRQKQQWPTPIAVIGTGHAGLRQAMFFIKQKELNFVVYDRKAKVGGTSWWDQANVTSKLQTEMGTYHLQYDEDNPVPTNMKTWPTRDELLAHFIEVAEEYGVMPYCKMCTNVKAVTIEKGDRKAQEAEMMAMRRRWATVNYKFTLEPTDGTGDGRGDHIGSTGEPCFEVDHSAIIMYPGNLTIPKRDSFKGEDLFGYPISYAIMNDFDYAHVTGRDVAILGHGAFAVENLRTCLEYSAKKVYMICRRKNLSCPRVVSWFVNQSYNFISAKLFLHACMPAYDLIGFDPWTYYAVNTNEKRTSVTIAQKSRFGIGDVYFIAVAMGVCEVVVDQIKRLTEGCVHLEGGKKIEAQCLLKLLGFNGNFDVDRLLNMKEIVGFWAESDFRRWIVAEPLSVNASNFGGTSFSPGARSWVEQAAFFLWYPSDFFGMIDSGMLPKHEVDFEGGRPAYVVDARHGTVTGVTVTALVPLLAESGGVQGPCKRQKQLECHPMHKFLQECEEEWMEYGRRWKANGAPKEIPAFPYTVEIVEEFLKMEIKELEDAAAAAESRRQ